MKKNDKQKHLEKDPHAQREADKYGEPIPSREYLLELLAEKDHLMTYGDFVEALGMVREEDLEALRRRLIAMARDGQLHCNRQQAYGPIDKFDLIRGRVDVHADGFGFLHPDDGGEKLFLSFRQMHSLMHGDTALVRVAGLDRRGRREGALVQVLERAVKTLVGRFYLEHNVSLVVPDNKHLHQEVLIPPDSRGSAQHEQIVVVKIVEYPTVRSQPIGAVTEVLGDHMAPGMEIDIAIRSYQLPEQWPNAVVSEAKALPSQVQEADLAGREDLRKLPFVTIDGEDARDFDDAVYCEARKKGWMLWVAIADVAHYVPTGSALDQEAYRRGNSVYFPERVIPMLPEALSNGLCSLNPAVNRLAMVCEVEISPKGEIGKFRFYNAVIYSHARMTYNQVADMLYESDEGLRKKHAALLPPLETLDALYRALHLQRERRGAIDFETVETQFVFGADKKIERIVPRIRNHAHRLIEECMITANVCAARYLAKNKCPTLYRVHDTPEPDKINDLRDFIAPFGLTLKGGRKPGAKHFAELLKTARQRPDANLTQTVLLRTMRQAVYGPENIGHFGLSLEEYAHFTSPIRRYPDLLVHRGIKSILRRESVKTMKQGAGYFQTAGEQCSMTERRADEATRDVVAWLKCEYMLDKIGEEYDGTISGVTSFGIFVELKNIHIEGLVHITSLGKDYYHFDPTNLSLRGESSGAVFRLGDPVAVRLMAVSLDERKIDFELVQPPEPRKRKARAPNEKPPRRKRRQ